jgi:hypothetical protein
VAQQQQQPMQQNINDHNLHQQQCQASQVMYHRHTLRGCPQIVWVPRSHLVSPWVHTAAHTRHQRLQRPYFMGAFTATFRKCRKNLWGSETSGKRAQARAPVTVNVLADSRGSISEG